MYIYICIYVYMYLCIYGYLYIFTLNIHNKTKYVYVYIYIHILLGPCITCLCCHPDPLSSVTSSVALMAAQTLEGRLQWDVCVCAIATC